MDGRVFSDFFLSRGGKIVNAAAPAAGFSYPRKSTLSTTMHCMHDETMFERLLLSIILCLAAMDRSQLVSLRCFSLMIKDYHNLIYEFHNLIGEFIMYCWKLSETS